jgi:hypothetical protein
MTAFGVGPIDLILCAQPPCIDVIKQFLPHANLDAKKNASAVDSGSFHASVIESWGRRHIFKLRDL